jgi:hypothetical protein
MIGTFLSLTVEADLDSRSARAITRWAIAGGYPEIIAIKAPKPVFVRVHRELRGQLVCVAVNYADEKVNLKIQYRDSPPDKAATAQDLTTRELAVVLDARDGLILGLD